MKFNEVQLNMLVTHRNYKTKIFRILNFDSTTETVEGLDLVSGESYNMLDSSFLTPCKIQPNQIVLKSAKSKKQPTRVDYLHGRDVCRDKHKRRTKKIQDQIKLLYKQLDALDRLYARKLNRVDKQIRGVGV